MGTALAPTLPYILLCTAAVLGDCLFANVPQGATKLVFTTENTADFSFVWLTNSLRIEDVEPDLVEVEPYLVGVYKANTDNPPKD